MRKLDNEIPIVSTDVDVNGEFVRESIEMGSELESLEMKSQVEVEVEVEAADKPGKLFFFFKDLLIFFESL